MNIHCFDGFGKSTQQVEYVKELGQKALGITNHGNITGLIKHYKACSDEGIVPILGCEFYFQPVFNKIKPRYHLCLYAKNMTGWNNLNKLITLSNKENFYKTGIITLKLLRKYSEGLICSSACIGGIVSAYIRQGKMKKALKAAEEHQKIFGDDYYLEIMPFDIYDDDTREEMQIPINKKLFKIADELDIKCIVTSDCHFIRQEDFDSYLKMHEIKDSDIGDHYHDRYIHTEEEILDQLEKFHPKRIKQLSKGMSNFYKKVEDTLEWFKFDDVDMPKYIDDADETAELMVKQCRKKLKSEGKTSKKYKERLKKEIDVITYHGFQDYFMIVQEYVNWAKENGCAVGPGRGSAGNSLVNYALGITELDAVYFNNNFDRFLRKDKKKFPDIDVDFSKENRDTVIQHIIDKYPGHAAQTLTYGCYNVSNLVNDLAKVCGMEDKTEIVKLKRYLEQYCSDKEHTIDDKLYRDRDTEYYNKAYDNIIRHFTKMYGKVRFFGTHASSVILCEDIESKAGLMSLKGNLRTSFDLHDIEYLKLLKLDVLGLSTVDKVSALRKATGVEFSYDILENEEMLDGFRRDGIYNVFQFESTSACDIAREIVVESFEDIVVATCLNRPGPLSLQLHKKYADAKRNENTDSPVYKYAQNTHGILIYQEQSMDVCKYIGKLDNENTDKLVKADLAHIEKEQENKWRKMFFKGAKEYGLSKRETEDIFMSLLQYSFNRGHGVAYAMLSAELMYYKVKYPLLFWYHTLKHESMENKLYRQKVNAVKDGCVILLPHVNGPADIAMEKVDGEYCLIEGMMGIKGVGEKAATIIEDERKANGDYTSYEDFIDRTAPNKRLVNKRVLNALKENGALIFDMNLYYSRSFKYNTSLYSRA